jgi:hypothetical protein
MNFKQLLISTLVGLICFGCQYESRQETVANNFSRNKIVICGPSTQEQSFVNYFSLPTYAKPVVKIDHQRYLAAGEISGLPPIVPNDNRIPAGIEKDGILQLDLEVKWGDFRMETPDRPGLKLVAIGEVGKRASIPSPLIRVKKGKTIRARVTNKLVDSTITIYGFQKRPYTISDSLFVLPGETGEVTFESGEAGTYLYWLKLGKGHKIKFFGEEDEQLAGAFIVDPEEGSPKDRVFVMNIFSSENENKEASPQGLESLTVNGLSWPFTERIRPSVGDTINWRVINASKRNHPMHLHGFYYDVLERGNTQGSTIFSEDQSPLVVTETLRPRETMNMQWVASRPGNWLFHCHLSFHVSSEVRLPGAEDADPKGVHQHMAGLVLGIQVDEGETDLISKGEDKYIDLYAAGPIIDLKTISDNPCNIKESNVYTYINPLARVGN